jgi:hypothetical protein
MKKCIHYIACDTIKYCREAEASAYSFRLNTSDVKIILYTDCQFKSSVFDEIIKIENLIPNGKTEKGWSEGKKYFEKKIELLSETKFEKNLYLDGDIKTLINVDCMFDMLNKFSFLIAHDSCRSTKWSDVFDIPIVFPDMNCGLIFYNKNTCGDFFSQWAINFQNHPQPHDQPAFRKTLWDSNLKFYIIPPEFNIRPKKFHHRQDPAIIHGRGDDFLPEVEYYATRIVHI